MKLTVTTLSDQIFTLEVSDELELENFKAMCEFESGVPTKEIALVWNGRPLHDDKMKLKEYGLKDGEMLLLQRLQAPLQGFGGQPNPTGAIDFSNIQIPGAGAGAGAGSGTGATPAASTSGARANPDDPAVIREMLLSSPHDLSLLKERNPPLADALVSGSLERFTEVLRKQQTERAEREREQIRMINADPFDPDAQSKIAEEIRLKNVESNMETAMEYAPESFGQVVMLYIDCTVNGHPVKAFVDSGAQMTIMSQACAERCNIKRLVDTRWAGIAKGVGTQKIIGRVHLCQIQIGPDFLQSSFSILEDQPMDMLLGLDMLKRHQCILDLKNGVLEIGTTGTKTPFLSESDLPEHARLNRSEGASEQMEEDKQLAEALAKSAQDSPAKPATSSASVGSSSASTSGSSPQFPEADIKRLTDYGFPRHQAIEELQRAGGNLDQALAALFAKSFHVP